MVAKFGESEKLSDDRGSSSAGEGAHADVDRLQEAQETPYSAVHRQGPADRWRIQLYAAEFLQADQERGRYYSVEGTRTIDSILCQERQLPGISGSGNPEPVPCHMLILCQWSRGYFTGGSCRHRGEAASLQRHTVHGNGP
jgi:hypothetical protein